MRELDELLLQSGNDVPFGPAQVTIHNPRLNEIAFIGEDNFHNGIHFLNFDKSRLSVEDKSDLTERDNFDIFMSMINDSRLAKYKVSALMVLALLFPQHKIKIEKDQILLQLENFSSTLNKINYEEFKEVLQQMFCLNFSADGGQDSYNPQDALAAKIAEKIKKGKEKRQKAKGEKGKISVYAHYVSVLSIGLKKDKNELMNYTVYQIRDEMTRFQLKEAFDMNIKARLAGAKDVEEVDNWMKELHP